MSSLTKELLRKFAAGELDDRENERVMDQLATDEASLALLEAVWEEELRETAVSTLPDLEPAQARQLWQRILHQIRQRWPKTR